MNTGLLSNINRIAVIDDDDSSRDLLGYPIADANMKPIYQNDPVSNLNTYLTGLNNRVDAIVSDHHLKKKTNYFPINGAEFSSICYQRKIPCLLVTKYEQPEILEIRKYRENIPVVLTPDEYYTDSLILGLEKCIKEFKGIITPERKSWRTLVRIDDVETNLNVYVIVPGWNSQEAIALNMNNLPDKLQKCIKPEMRLFVRVNIGNENPNELFFKDWEF